MTELSVSVIVPTLNECEHVERFVEHHLQLENLHELILVDGGSTDSTVERARQFEPAIKTLSPAGRSGRASQMNAGAAAATAQILLFLHVDCLLDKSALVVIQQTFRQNPGIIGGGFLKKYTEESALLRLYRMMMNGVRTRLFHNLVGTNAIFIRRQVFEQIGGYRQVPILEDVVLCDEMKKRGQLVFLKPHVRTSSRRYTAHGRWARIWTAARILFMYRVLKAPFETLKKVYTG